MVAPPNFDDDSGFFLPIEDFIVYEVRHVYEPIAVAIDKGDSELGAKVKEIVSAMHADGTLSKLSMKWFKVDYTVTK